MQTMLSKINWESLSVDYSNAKPFNHIVIDNFFVNDFAIGSINDCEMILKWILHEFS